MQGESICKALTVIRSTNHSIGVLICVVQDSRNTQVSDFDVVVFGQKNIHRLHVAMQNLQNQCSACHTQVHAHAQTHSNSCEQPNNAYIHLGEDPCTHAYNHTDMHAHTYTRAHTQGGRDRFNTDEYAVRLEATIRDKKLQNSNVQASAHKHERNSAEPVSRWPRVADERELQDTHLARVNVVQPNCCLQEVLPNELLWQGNTSLTRTLEHIHKIATFGQLCHDAACVCDQHLFLPDLANLSCTAALSGSNQNFFLVLVLWNLSHVPCNECKTYARHGDLSHILA